MESNYSMMLYQTSFVIDNIHPKVCFSRLKQLIWSWITSKETFDYATNSRVYDFDRNPRYEPFQKEFRKDFRTDTLKSSTKGWAIFNEGKFRPVTVWGQGEGCRIHTTICFKGRDAYWGCRYYEREENCDIMTDIGIHQAQTKTVFAIKVSLRPRNSKEIFLPAVPLLMNAIWRDDKCEKKFDIYTQGAPYSYFDEPQEIENESDAKKVVDFISNPERRCPVLIAVVNRLEPEVGMATYTALAKRILGKALVLKVMAGTEAHQALSTVRSTVGIWKLNVGGLYLIHPGFSVDEKCPFEEYSLGELEKCRLGDGDGQENRAWQISLPARLFVHIHRQHLSCEEGAVYFEDVQRLLEDAMKERYLETEALYSQALATAVEAEAELEKADSTNEALLREKVKEARERVLRVSEEKEHLRDEMDAEHFAMIRASKEIAPFIAGFNDDIQSYRRRDKEQKERIEALEKEIRDYREKLAALAKSPSK